MDLEKLPEKLKYAKFTGKKIRTLVMYIKDFTEMSHL